MPKDIGFEFERNYYASRKKIRGDSDTPFIDVDEDYIAMMQTSRIGNSPEEKIDRQFCYALLSGGKDSVCMVTKILANLEEFPLDAVCFIDTGAEFPVMYRNAMECMRRVEEFNKEHDTNIETNILHPAMTWFQAFASGYKRNWKKSTEIVPSGKLVCEDLLRTSVFRTYESTILAKGYTGVTRYVGRNLTDESKSTVGKKYRKKEKSGGYAYSYEDNYNSTTVCFPLLKYKINAQEAFETCKAEGYNYEGFYQDFEHGYCILCPRRPLKDYRKIWQNYPEIWDFMVKKTDIAPYLIVTGGYSLRDMQRRFEFEVEYCKKNKGVIYENIINTNLSKMPRFAVSLYLTLGTYNQAFQEKAQELLTVKANAKWEESSFFSLHGGENYTPIVAYNIIDEEEVFFADLSEFAKLQGVKTDVVRQYCNLSLRGDVPNQDRIFNDQFLLRYTFGKEYKPTSLPILKEYGWVTDTTNEVEELRKIAASCGDNMDALAEIHSVAEAINKEQIEKIQNKMDTLAGLG